MVKMSKIFKWDTDLSVNFDKIDEQHKEFINRLNRLINALALDKGEEEVGEAIKFLDGYIKEHFGMEEHYMSLNNYQYYREHKIEHNKFVDSFQAWKKDYELVGPTKELALIIVLQMGIWLLNHFRRVDKELGVFLNANTKP